MSSVASAIRVQDLTLGYDRRPAVHHLDGTFLDGSLTALVGPNGGGKSTLLKGIAGLLRPLAGRLLVEGVGRQELAYLPQVAEIDRSFPICVIDVVSYGLWRRIGLFKAIGGGALIKAREALAAVGLEGFENRPIGTLSGGELQRALFARLLLQDARIILLDEPFTAIDAKTTADLIELVCRWNGEGRTIIAALHDMEQVRRYFPETLLIAREPIAWGPTADVLRPENLLRARRLDEAWDETSTICDRSAA